MSTGKSVSTNGNTSRRRKRETPSLQPPNKNPKLTDSEKSNLIEGEKNDVHVLPTEMDIGGEGANKIDEMPGRSIINENNDDFNKIPILNANKSKDLEPENALYGNEDRASKLTEKSEKPADAAIEKGDESENPADAAIEKEDESEKTKDESSEKGDESDKPSNEFLPGKTEGVNGEPEKSVDESSEKSNESEKTKGESSPGETEGENDESNTYLNGYFEIYLDKGYATQNEGKVQYYAKNRDKDETYFTGPTGEEIYAAKVIQIGDSYQTVEYPARNKDGESEYIYRLGVPRYPENKNTGELIFPRDPETNEEIYIANSDGTINDYPSNKFGRQFYRKDADNNEVPLPSKIYAKVGGDQIYPKLSNGDEYYLTKDDNKTEYGAYRIVNGEQIQYYARKKNGDEIYPRMWL